MRPKPLSYEEYAPYGTTAYFVQRQSLESPKRYHFSDKELDTENGLYYSGARYYSASACRWFGCDPGGFLDNPDTDTHTDQMFTGPNPATGRASRDRPDRGLCGLV